MGRSPPHRCKCWSTVWIARRSSRLTSGTVTRQTSVRVQGTVTDTSPTTVSVAGVVVPVSMGAFASDVPLGADGDAAIAVIATDAAGNVANASIVVTVDRAAPAIEI